MAVDGIYLYSLVEDLKKSILNSKIDKINQPEKDEIIITLRKERKNLKLLVSASPKYPRFNLTEVIKANPLQAPMFTMVLRKYLIGGKIIDIVQLEGDRIVKFLIESSDELGFNSIYTLIVEIMGRHSNITLVRERDNKIMECIKHISPSMNSFRVLYPGITYKLPTKSTKINPFSYNNTTLQEFVNNNSITFNKNFFVSCFTGISKPLSEHLFMEYNKTYNDFSIENISIFLSKFLKDLIDNEVFTIYKDKDGNYVDFYMLPLDQLEDNFTPQVFDNIHETLCQIPLLGRLIGNMQPLGVWGMKELTVIFLLAAIIIGKMSHMKEKEMISLFVGGCQNILGVAITLGCAKGLSVIMADGLIMDTILHFGEILMSGVSRVVFPALSYMKL